MMNIKDIFPIESYDLPDLTELVKQIWNSPAEWYLNEGKIGFLLPKSNGMREWFPLHNSPEKVESFVRAWYKSGALYSVDR